MADSKTQQAADDASQAAYNQAAQSHWPPTKEDVELIGAAAGAAAGTALGGPIGSIIGTAVGGFVGGVVYDIIDAIPNAGDNPAARCVVQLRETGKAYHQTIIDLADSCKTTEEAIVARLDEWGWRMLTDRNICRNPDAAFPAIEENKKQFFRAVSAVSAECATYSAKPKASLGKVVIIGGGIGALLWLLKSKFL